MPVLNDANADKLICHHFGASVHDVRPADPLLAELQSLRKAIERQEKAKAKEVEPKLLLTLTEAAQALGVSRRTIDGLTNVRSKKPRLKTVREGNIIRVTRDDLEDYVRRLRQEAGLLPIRKG